MGWFQVLTSSGQPGMPSSEGRALSTAIIPFCDGVNLGHDCSVSACKASCDAQRPGTPSCMGFKFNFAHSGNQCHFATDEEFDPTEPTADAIYTYYYYVSSPPSPPPS